MSKTKMGILIDRGDDEPKRCEKWTANQEKKRGLLKSESAARWAGITSRAACFSFQHITCLKHGDRTEIWSTSSVIHYVTLLCWMLSYRHYTEHLGFVTFRNITQQKQQHKLRVAHIWRLHSCVSYWSTGIRHM
jgi:hypothetical protein